MPLSISDQKFPAGENADKIASRKPSGPTVFESGTRIAQKVVLPKYNKLWDMLEVNLL